MTTKHEIEIEGFPEGWQAVAYRVPGDGERILSDDYVAVKANGIKIPCLIVEKIKPCRIVFEDTGETRQANSYEYYEHNGGFVHNGHLCTAGEYRIWRIVEEE